MTKHDRRFAPIFLGALVLSALVATPPFVARGQDAAAEAADGVSIQFPNADINKLILPEYERLTGRKVIRDNSILGATISIETSGVLPREKAADFIEKTLLLNGYALVPTREENLYKIIAYDAGKQVRSEGVPVIVNPDQLPESDEVVTFIMPLSNLSPEKAAETFSQIVPSHSYGNITALENATAVVVTDNSSVIRRLLELRDQIDVPPSQLEDRAFQLTRADAEEVAESLIEILGIDSGDSSGDTGSRRVVTPGQNQANAVGNGNPAAQAAVNGGALALGNSAGGPAPSAAEPKIHAMSRTNRILVVARPVDMAYIERLIEHFDSPAEMANRMERKLNYVTVSSFLQIARDALLRGLEEDSGGSQISGADGSLQNRAFGTAQASQTFGNNSSGFGSGRSGFGGNSGFGGSGSSFGGSGSDLGGAGQDEDAGPQSLVVGKTLLIADNVHNALIASGPPEHLEMINDLLDSMDVRPRQIQISAIIAQLTLGDDFEFGFDLLRTLETVGPDGRRYNGAGIFKSRTGAAQTILDIDTLDVVDNFLPAAQGFTFYGQINPYLNAFLSTLSSTNRFKVLSRPTVYTVNNKQAVIQTGQRVAVPRSTQSSLDTTGNNATNQIVTASIDFEEVLLRIQVLPLINSEDEITLRIQQLNDSIVGSQVIGGDEIPTIGTQSLGTTVMVPDGATVLLGGLISEDENKSESGLPTFTNMPLIGKVFGSQGKSANRQELLIFIQPKIIDDPADQHEIDQHLITRTEVGPDAVKFGGDEPSVKVEPAKDPTKGWFRKLFSRD